MKPLLRHILRDRRGGAILEFSILAPALITLILGTFQVGIWMQAHNALRSIASDTARYAAVEYQKEKMLTNADLISWATGRATASPYLLKASDFSVTSVTTTSRVSGTEERTLTIYYTIPTFLSLVGIKDLTISYQRPVFIPA